MSESTHTSSTGSNKASPSPIPARSSYTSSTSTSQSSSSHNPPSIRSSHSTNSSYVASGDGRLSYSSNNYGSYVADPLDVSYSTALTREMRLHIACALLNKKPSLYTKSSSIVDVDINFPEAEAVDDEISAYTDYYQQECRMLKSAVLNSPGHACVSTHRDILNVIKLISAHRCELRGTIREKLSEIFPGAAPRQIDNSIDLALRLWTMLNFRNRNDPSMRVASSTLSWDDGTTLEDCINDEFYELSEASKRFTGSNNIEFPSEMIFNAYTMHRIAGIDIVWTTNLGDHLRYNAENKKLDIFHMASFYRGHGGFETRGASRASLRTRMDEASCIIPVDVLKEINKTVGFLFPSWHARSVKFLEAEIRRAQKHREERIDPQLREIKEVPTQEYFNSSSYQYFGERLVILHREFKSAQPTGFSQLWADDRNKQQWYTFWVAVIVLVLTIIFGAISSVTGILQVWLSWKAQ